MITAVFILLSCAGCGKQAEPADRSLFALDTYITMRAVGLDADGNVYWHILDPQAGYPARNGLIYVTVVSPEGKRSDALSTALFVMGMERAIEYWHKHGGFEMLFVTEDGDICMTEGWRRSVPIRSVFTWDIYLTRDCPSSVCPIVW